MADKATAQQADEKARAGAGAPADVVIAGGGMVGLTLAAALGGAGLSVTVLDRLDRETQLAEPFDGRTAAIAYGSQRLYDQLGIWPLMAPAAEPIRDIRVSDGPSLLHLHYDHRELRPLGRTATAEDEAPPPPFGYIIENRETRRALFRHLETLPSVRFMAPAAVAGIVPPEGGSPVTALRLENGDLVSGRLIVAADGSRSRLRRMMGIRTTDWDYPQSGIVCVMGHERPHEGVAHERFLPSGPFAVLPMTDNPGDPRGPHRSSIVWTEKRRLVPAMMALDDDNFAFEMKRRFGPWLGGVWVAGPRWSYPLRLLHAERYVAQRFALIGDAAHTIHPIAGQGLNLGLRDVAALAEVLVDAWRLGLDIGAPDVLGRYQRWRRFDNVALAGVTDVLNRLFSNDIAPLRLARDLGLAAVNRLPPLKRLFMRHAMGVVGTDLPRLIRGEPL